MDSDSGCGTLRIQNVDCELTLLTAGIPAEYPDPIATAKLVGPAGLSNRIGYGGLRTDDENLRTAHLTGYRYSHQRLHHELGILLEPREESAKAIAG